MVSAHPRFKVTIVTGGYGHFGVQHDTKLTFGLGAACAIDSNEKVKYTAPR